LLKEIFMRRHYFVIIVGALAAAFAAPAVSAQTPDNFQFPKVEIFGAYSAIETNNHNVHFGPAHGGFNARDTDFDEGGSGFEVAVIRNLNRYFGIMGDFSAHFSHDQGPVTLMPHCAQPPCAPVTQTAELNPTLFNFLAGPEFKWRNRSRFTPFVHALFGVAYTTTTFKTAGPAVRLNVTDADTGFAMAYGGGLEIRITPKVSFRVSLDYGKAYVGSDALPPQRVNSVGYSAGLVFH
jgi:opacity protein-like surface antigen